MFIFEPSQMIVSTFSCRFSLIVYELQGWEQFLSFCSEFNCSTLSRLSICSCILFRHFPILSSRLILFSMSLHIFTLIRSCLKFCTSTPVKLGSRHIIFTALVRRKTQQKSTELWLRNRSSDYGFGLQSSLVYIFAENFLDIFFCLISPPFPPPPPTQSQHRNVKYHASFYFTQKRSSVLPIDTEKLISGKADFIDVPKICNIYTWEVYSWESGNILFLVWKYPLYQRYPYFLIIQLKKYMYVIMTFGSPRI